MKRLFACFILFSLSSFAQAANQQCTCTVASNCTLVADIAPSAFAPVSCTLKENGNTVATGAVVLTSTLPTTGSSVCAPASPGPAGSTWSCSIGGIAYPVGTHTVTFTVNYPAPTLPAGPSAPYSFDSIAATAPGGGASNGRIK